MDTCKLYRVAAGPWLEWALKQKDNDGGKPLHVTSCRGQLQVVNELLEHGAGIESKGPFDFMPLHYACSNRHVAVVNELVAQPRIGF
jgi:ankyrin repeat protein